MVLRVVDGCVKVGGVAGLAGVCFKALVFYNWGWGLVDGLLDRLD